MNGENRLFTVAVAVSLLVHVAVLWWVQVRPAVGSDTNAAPVFSTIKVSLDPARKSPEREVVQRESRPREKTETPVRQPQPVVTDAPANEVTAAAESSAVSDDSAEHGDADEMSAPSAQAGGGAVDTGARDRYLASVLAQIESHKFYPQTARRRGLQGSVEVCFKLDARGMISDLHVSGSSSLFVEAAKSAVRNAIPLPNAPSIDGFPLFVRYQMVFRLQ